MDRSKFGYTPRGRGRGRPRGARKQRGGRSRGSRSRGRNVYRTYQNDIGRSSYNWQRPQSPVEGSEEFMNRKIEKTSAIIMRHLLNPNESLPVSTKSNNSHEDISQIGMTPIAREDNINSAEKTSRDKSLTKAKKTNNPHLTAKQIYEKIMNHIANLNDGRKKNFVFANNRSGLNQALTDIQKQNRLELSRILRDMSSLSDNRNCNYDETSIVPDIGINMEELPAYVIEELKRTLNMDLLNLTEAIEEPNWSPPTSSLNSVPDGCIGQSPSERSLELHNAVSSIQIKREDKDEVGADIVSISRCPSVGQSLDYISSSQSCEVVADSSTPINGGNNEMEIKVEAADNNVTVSEFPPNEVDIKDETEQMDISATFLSHSSGTTVKFPYKANHGTINDQNNFEQDSTDVASGTTQPVHSNEEPCHSLRGLENTIFQVLASDRRSNCKNLENVIEKMELLDGCVQHLTSYRVYLMRSILSLSRRTHSSATNDYPSSKDHSFSSNVPPAAQSTTVNEIATISGHRVFDADNRIMKKRKTSVDEPAASKPLQDSHDANNVKRENHIETPLRLRLQDKITCMEKVDHYLLLATQTGNIIYASLHDSSLEYTLDVTQSPITSIKFINGLNDFIYMYVGCLDEVLRVYDFRGRKLLRANPICDQIRCMDYMWDYLFMGCKNGSLIRYSRKKERVEFEEKNLGSDILVVKAVQEGPRRVLLVGHRNAPIYVRDAMSGLCLRNFSNEAVAPTIYSIVINGNSLYCGTARNNILIFSFHEGNLIDTIIADKAIGISCMKIKEKLLFVGCYNGLIYIYNVDGNKLVTTLKGPGGGVQCMEVLSTQIVVGTISGQFASLTWPSNNC